MNKPAADTPAIPGVPPAGPAAVEHPIARVLPLLSPAHLDRDFDYLVPPELDALAQPGVRVRVRFAGRLVDGYLLERRTHSDHGGKLVALERVVSGERVLTPEILQLATAVAARYAGTRADVLRLAIPPRHARTETGGAKKKSAEADAAQEDSSAATKAGKRRGGSAASVPLKVKSASDVGVADSAGVEADSVEDKPAVDSTASAGAASAVSSVAAQRVSTTPAGVNEPVQSSESASPTTVSDRIETDSVALDPAVAPEFREGAVTAAADPVATQDVSSVSSGTDGATPPMQSSSDVPPNANSAGGVADSVNGDRAADEGSSADAPSEKAESAGTQEDSSVSSGTDAAPESNASNAAETAADSAADPSRTTAAADDSAEPVSGSATAQDDQQVTVDHGPWGRYIHGPAFMTALEQGKGPRAAWQALPGEDWPRRLAELAASVVGRGRSAILMVPDQRDLDRVLAECTRLMGDSAVGLSAGLGPAARYRRWLAVLRGTALVVVGTRSAVFAPAKNLGLIAIWDDGDDTYAEPRSPYPHAREVAMLRSHETGAAFVAAGFARTAEIQAVVESGWAHDLVADRMVVRDAAPRISVPGDTDIALERDPVARAVRIPGVAYAAARSALKEGAGVLVQVPRRGYVPSLACAKCRTPARCRHCNGPLALPDGRARHSDSQGDAAHSPNCRWCGITEAAFRCASCGSRALRAVVIGAQRTAEELGRAFPGVPIRGSGGGAMLDTVEPGPQVVVATVGAEPVLPGGYGVALLLDSWALLGRADLRASEDALRRWMTAATLVRSRGQVIVMGDPGIPTVQALVRWDPVGHARVELASRAEVGFPPAVRMAAVDGTSESINELLTATDLPDDVDVLGPVPLPDGARKPFTSGDSPAEVERILLRVDRKSGAALARALTAAQAIRSTHRSDAPLRVQIDPVDIG